MTPEKLEELRQEWRRRLDRAVAQVIGPLENLSAPFGILTRAQHIERQAETLERELLEVQRQDPEPPRRKDRDWTTRKRMGR